MAVLTKQRTYSVIPRVAVAQQGSALLTNQRLLRLIVDNMISAGAVCYYSCNGTVAGTAGDAVNRWASDSDVVFDDAGNAHSWMVLTLPAGLGGHQLLLEATKGGGGAANGFVHAYASVGGWTGGTTTAIPTLAVGGELALDLSLSSGCSGILPPANYAAHLSVITANDGTSMRVICTDDGNNDAVISMVLLERFYDGPVAWPYSFGGSWRDSDNPNSEGGMVIWAEDATSSVIAFITLIEGAFRWDGNLPLNDADGLMMLTPAGVLEGTVGWAGYIPDLFWSINDGTTYSKTIPSGTGRAWACFGGIVVPWDSTTDLGNGSTNARVLAMAQTSSSQGASRARLVNSMSGYKVQQNVAGNIPVYVVQTDQTPAVGLVSGDFTTKSLSKHNGTFSSFSPTITERGEGWYNVPLSSGNNDTLGMSAIHLESAGCDPVDVHFQVVGYDPNSALATAAAVADVQTDTNDLQTRLPAALVSGRIDAYVGSMGAGVVTAAAVATDAIDADALATNAVTEIQSGLATSSALSTLGTAISNIQSDTDNIQTRLPAALSGGRMDSVVNAMAAGVITAAVVATDAIDADALAASAVTEIQSGLVLSADIADINTKLDTLEAVAVGRWRVVGNQLILYQLDGTTPLATFNLLDDSGDPSSTRIFERVPV